MEVSDSLKSLVQLTFFLHCIISQLCICTACSDQAVYGNLPGTTMAKELQDLVKQIQDMSAEDREVIAQACGRADIKPDPSGQEGLASTASSGSGTGNQTRISQFSGDGAKGDVSFEQWRFEVRSMLKDAIFSEPIILQTLRRSLRGTAADVLLHMGADVSVKDVLTKMERIFGNILPPEAILERFYSAKQLEVERVATWACRLEDSLSKLQDCQDKHNPLVSAEVARTMLRTKFYSGLRPGALRNALRHTFDGGASYEELLVAARVAELEEDQDKKAAKVQQVSAAETSVASKLDKVLAELGAMNQRLQKVEEAQKKTSNPQQGQSEQKGPKGPKRPFTGKCFNCGQMGHPKFRCPLNDQQPASGGRQQAERTQAPNPN